MKVLESDFKSRNIELEEDIQVYKQYEGIDNLQYHVEKENMIVVIGNWKLHKERRRIS